jgi:hypothetical protein
MLIIRLILVLLVITAMLLLGLYLLYEDKKYLLYFKKTLTYSLFLLLFLTVLFMLRRLL